MKCSRQAQFLILLCFQRVAQVKTTETRSLRQEEERKVEAGKQIREETGQQTREDLDHHVERCPKQTSETPEGQSATLGFRV